MGSSVSAASAASFDLIVRAPTTVAPTRRRGSPTLSNICTRLYAKAVVSFATSIQVGKMLSRNLSAVTTRAIDPQFMSSYRI